MPLMKFPALLILALLLLSTALACGTSDRDTSPGEELEAVWEAWGVVKESYAHRESIEPEKVVSAALLNLLGLVDGDSYPFLTDVGRVRGQAPPGVPPELGDVWRALVLFQERWPDIERPRLAATAISGMVAGLGDPAAAFLNAEAYPEVKQHLEENLEGEYRGIGARVIAQNEQILMFPFDDTPAEKAGIQDGDVLFGGRRTTGRRPEPSGSGGPGRRSRRDQGEVTYATERGTGTSGVRGVS